MSEIWSCDQLTLNMESLMSDSVFEEESFLSTWLSQAIQFDGNCTGIEHNIFDHSEPCEKPMEVYGATGAYSDVFQSGYVEQSPNYACSDAVSLSIENVRTNPQYNSVGNNGYICSSLQDPTAISFYCQEDCMKYSCPNSDQSRAISVSPSPSSSCEQEGSHVRVHHNSNEGFLESFDGYPAFHSCEDLMKNMLPSSSMAEFHFSNLPVYNIAMQNLSEGGKDDAGNLAQKVDAVFKSKSEGDDQMYCYVNQFPRENEREETNQMPVNDSVEDLHPPWKRHCSVNKPLMADRAKVNVVPAVESSCLMSASNIEPTLSSSVAGTLCNTNGKPRARRGSARDPQSLYARQRRERINERLKVLQNLIPNGTKVDISTMLEEALHYVKFLQLQIKILSSDDHWKQGPINAFHAVNAACQYSRSMKTGI